MSITHQDIVDRIEALGRERSEAYERESQRIERERTSLQELCGSLGHAYGEPRGTFRVLNTRECVVCGARIAAAQG